MFSDPAKKLHEFKNYLLRRKITAPELTQKMIKLESIKKAGASLVCSLLFASMHTQWPLYSSNQNTYFSRGLAETIRPNLKNDWFINTQDPFPIFTYLVKSSITHLDQTIFYFYHFLLLLIFIYSMLKINEKIWIQTRSTSVKCYQAIILATLFSPLPTVLSYLLFGEHVHNKLVHGLAGQYLFGHILQPSHFGTLLAASVALLLHRHHWLAILALTSAVYIHSGYLFTAGLIVIGYFLYSWFCERNLRRGIETAVFSALLVLPLIIYTASNFAPSSAHQMAFNLLFDQRIPHHANIETWFDGVELAKIIFMIFVTLLVRKESPFIFVILSVLIVGSSIFTFFALYFDDIKVLKMLFPWRVTTLIQPVCICLLTGFICSWISQQNQFVKREYLTKPGAPIGICLFLIFASNTYTLNKYASDHRVPEYLDVITFVKARNSTEDVILVPDEWANFRIEAGTPIVVDFKSHPYLDREIIEWFERVESVRAAYRSGHRPCNHLQELKNRYGVTLMVDYIDRSENLCTNDAILFQNSHYIIVRL